MQPLKFEPPMRRKYQSTLAVNHYLSMLALHVTLDHPVPLLSKGHSTTAYTCNHLALC